MQPPPSPMLSSPLKATDEIDWIVPLQDYLKAAYPTHHDSFYPECAKVQKLRQEARAAGREPPVGCDLLFRYYGQLELLDLRFPVNDQHVKVLFTWYDAFTQKPTSQRTLAFEKACILYNIAAVLSLHAARQNRVDDLGLKTAYHAFQRAAGTFADISRYFLHAPSSDLNHETVQCLSDIMLAQAQEVCLEKQLNDRKSPSHLAKIASQAAHNYELAIHRTEEITNKEIFDKSWPLIVRLKRAYLSSLASYNQALVDQTQGKHGFAISRLQHAAHEATTASIQAKALERRSPSATSLPAESAVLLETMIQQHMKTVEKASIQANRDNDLIYHEVVPSEQSLPAIPMLPAASLVPFSELYQPDELQRAIGPDIFKKIIPFRITQSASIYDEKKAELLRNEVAKAQEANDDIRAALDKFDLPQSLEALKANPDIKAFGMPSKLIDQISALADKETIDEKVIASRQIKHRATTTLHTISAQIAKEETVCEQMRSKYGARWVQQPSAPLTVTIRQDIENYRSTLSQAAESDAAFLSAWGQYEGNYVELLHALAAGELDALFQRYMTRVGESDPNLRTGPQTRDSQGTLLDDVDDEEAASSTDRLAFVEDVLHKLKLLQQDRDKILDDLRNKVHQDDITEPLIWNGHALDDIQEQIFSAELDKFRPLQNRMVQAKHSQESLLRQLSTAYPDMKHDEHIRGKQQQSVRLQKQKALAIAELNKICAEFGLLMTGLMQAGKFYGDIQATMAVLAQNVETFVQNRKNEGAEILRGIEFEKQQLSASASMQHPGDLAQALGRLAVSNEHQSATSQYPITPPVPVSNAQPSPEHYRHHSASLSIAPSQASQNSAFIASNSTPRTSASNRTSGSYSSPYAHTPPHAQLPSDYHNSYYQLYAQSHATDPPFQHPARAQTHPTSHPHPAKRASLPVYPTQPQPASHPPTFVPSMSHSPPPITHLKSAGPAVEPQLSNHVPSATTYSTWPPASSSQNPSHHSRYDPVTNRETVSPPSYRPHHHHHSEPVTATGAGIGAVAQQYQASRSQPQQGSPSTSATASDTVPPKTSLPVGWAAGSGHVADDGGDGDDPWASLNRWG